MKQVTYNEFINKLINFDSALISHIKVKELGDNKNNILTHNNSNIEYTRQGFKKSSCEVIFKLLYEGKVIDSYLNLDDYLVYNFMDYYMLVEKNENDNSYRIIYKISNNKTLDFTELEKQQKREEKELVRQEKEKLKNDKIKEHLEYFKNECWNKDKISKLTSLQMGRLKKCLNKLYNHEDGAKSLKNIIEDKNYIEIVEQNATFNPAYYEKLLKNGFETQKSIQYEKNIKTKKEYIIIYDDSYMNNIPKIVYDIINL